MRQELERLLDTHRAQRPEMQPQDYYKLLYQREFGCGHTAPAPETAGRHLMEEYARAAGLPGADAVPEHVKGAALPGCVEDIGNGLCRIYLNGSWSREALRLLGRVFCATAREHKGETACFAAALDGLAHWADAVLPPRDAQTLRRQTGTLRAAGCPAVHHSAAYREQYAPHYRVVRRCYADAWPALLLAQRVLESVSPGGHALLAIDGRCGSGKSTLAAHMAQVFGCPVFHMDDFFCRRNCARRNVWPSPVKMCTMSVFCARRWSRLQPDNPCVFALSTAPLACPAPLWKFPPRPLPLWRAAILCIRPCASIIRPRCSSPARRRYSAPG